MIVKLAKKRAKELLLKEFYVKILENYIWAGLSIHKLRIIINLLDMIENVPGGKKAEREKF
ncbi:MAG: hypothetical protein M0Z59_10190 [Nitrospiraceae bacterium]|nr:hypothetical protein [Nitrospiraceae bacterium]